MNLHRRISKKVLLILTGDIAIFYAALYMALVIRYGSDLASDMINTHAAVFGIIFALWLIIFGVSGFYDLRSMKNEKVFLYRLLRVMAINIIAAITVFYLFPFAIEPRRNLFTIASLSAIGIFAWRYFFNLLIIRAGVTRVIFMGFNTEMMVLAGFLLRHPQLGHKPIAFISHQKQPPTLILDINHIPLDHPQLSRAIKDTKPDMIVISPEMKGDKMTVSILLSLIPLGISVAEFPAFHEAMTGKIPLSLIEEVWFLENLIGIRKRSYEFAKRGIDMLLAFAIGIAGIISFPFVATAIMLESPGPIFFRQQRVGRNGKIFILLKYRSTYRTLAPATVAERTKDEYGVYTRIGKILRASYTDEIPQVINVLKGEMSFIGPRPERPEYVKELKEKIPFYETRLLVPPGITGWAQVNMENDASVEDAPEKLQYDLYYIKNRMLILDLLIALRTLSAMVRRQGR